jgi:hypothetical protein
VVLAFFYHHFSEGVWIIEPLLIEAVVW